MYRILSELYLLCSLDPLVYAFRVSLRSGVRLLRQTQMFSLEFLMSNTKILLISILYHILAQKSIPYVTFLQHCCFFTLQSHPLQSPFRVSIIQSPLSLLYPYKSTTQPYSDPSSFQSTFTFLCAQIYFFVCFGGYTKDYTTATPSPGPLMVTITILISLYTILGGVYTGQGIH